MEYSQLPEWNAQGVEPPQTKKNSGWQPGERPPAPWFNWLFHRIYQSFIEIRNAFNSHEEATQGVHGLGPTETVESTAGAQAKADAARAAAERYADSVAGAVQADLDSHKADGGAHGATSDATPHAIIRRDSAGRAKVAAPSASDDIATKEYVDQKADAEAASALSSAQAYTDSAVALHAQRTDNPHGVTKSQVGLGNVENYPVASQQEAEAGTASNRYMTPLRTAQAIAALAPVKSVAGRTGAVTLSKSDVGLGNVENYGIATQAEAEAGSVNNKYMTPLRVAQAIAALHANRRDNPHQVQAQQVPYSSGVSGFTPATVKAALDALAGVRIVEMGVNSNGFYVRWENGWQVCWNHFPANRSTTTVTGPLYRDDADTIWIFPAAFTGNPTVFGTVLGITDNNVRLFFAPHSFTTTSVTYRDVATASSSSLGRQDYLLALGRWK